MCEANQAVPDWLVAMADRYQAHRERMRENGQGRFLAKLSSKFNFDELFAILGLAFVPSVH